jgi:phage terminase small subunit
MEKPMSKKSQAELKIIPLQRQPTGLQPPTNLPAPERALFIELVAANAHNHFRASDLPLLVSYCSAVVLHERAIAALRATPVVGTKSSPWLNVFEKTGRAMVALSMRLRLSPQARKPNQIKGRAPAPLSHYERTQLQQMGQDPDDTDN